MNSENKLDFPTDSSIAREYENLRLKPDASNLDPHRSHLLATYADMYNELLRRILPITAGVISEEQLERILRRGVIPAFQKAQEANRDPLTGLPKRNVLKEITGRYMDLIKQGIGGVVTFVYIDIDNFKEGVNDQYGHRQGDEILRIIGGILQKVKRSYDMVGVAQEKDRLAGKTAEGDEFGVVFFGTEETPPNKLKQRIEDELKSYEGISGMEAIGISMGVAKFDSLSDQKMNADDLIHNADTAMYHAKLISGSKVKYVGHIPGMVAPPVIVKR
ncbi:GGDEF domain-containing protein [Candidatus Gottesmanbacteria bacterium]|nr:GGDEF domain-containing protein [Candidatus Gottesmanbacteria bacterium]MBI5452649.1 GGDEF domain-containing protein [Candidatus Gottesmanbacteria bacterium]